MAQVVHELFYDGTDAHVIEHIIPATRSLRDAIMDGAQSMTSSLWGTVAPLLKERTPIEKVALGGLSAYCAWKIYDGGALTCAVSTLKVCIPGFRWVRRRLGYYEVCYGNQFSTITTSMESRRVGSEERDMTRPKSQCIIAQETDGKMMVLGCAIRLDGNHLVAPDHVIGGDENVEKFAKGNQSWVSLKGKERILLDADLAAIYLTDKELSTIGVTVAKVGPVIDPGTFGQVVGPECKGTIGQVKNDPLCFGRLIYSGTTLGGYSGSAYTAGNHVLGLHQMGGNVNGGYSASYVRNLLMVHLKQRFETDERTIVNQFKAGKKIYWKISGDPSTVQVRVNGQYDLIDVETMTRAFGADWQQNPELYHRKDLDRYGDYESALVVPSDDSVQGESHSSNCLGASSLLENSQGPADLNVQSLTEMYQSMSASARKRFRNSQGLMIRQKSALNGPERSDRPRSSIA
nr:hypothetical protein [Solemoviridae sp.]